MKTGNTQLPGHNPAPKTLPQWSPVMKTGNTGRAEAWSPRPARLNGARS